MVVNDRLSFDVVSRIRTTSETTSFRMEIIEDMLVVSKPNGDENYMNTTPVNAIFLR